MKKLLLIISLILILLFSIPNVSKEKQLAIASTGEWELLTKGIDAATVRAIAIDPENTQIVYVGTWGSGVYKSIDGGNNWFKPYEGNSFVDVNNILIDPSNTNVIYVSTWDNGIWKSLDKGVTWGNLFQATGGFFSMDPFNNKILYFGAQGGRIYKTEDAGVNWKLLKTIDGAGRISISIDPKNPNVIYVGAENIGFLKSIDGGANWNMQNTGLTSNYILSLAVDPNNSQNIYLGCTFNGGIFKSTDGGNTWKQVYAQGNIWSMIIDPKSPNTIYGTFECCGIVKSANGGLSWEHINTPANQQNFRSISVDPTNTNIIFLGSWGGGVFKSNNGGLSWEESSLGLNDVQVDSFLIDRNSSIYILVSRKGIYKSTKNELNWIKTDSGIDYYHWPYKNGIYIDPADNNTLYVIRDCCGIFKTVDGGKNWTNLQKQWDNGRVGAIAIDPKNHLVIYAGIGTIWDANGNYLGVLKSEDGGSTWKSIGLKDKEITEIQIDPVSNIIYVGTTKGLFKSDDQGKTWKDMNLPYSIYSIAIDPKNSPSVLYVGTESNGGYKTFDDGKNWQKIGYDNGNETFFVINPTNNNVVYEAIWGPGIYKSTDAGKTWTQLAGIDGCVTNICFDPNNPEDLYASTRGGLYKWIIKYSVVAKSSKGGTISPSGTVYYKQGESQSFTFAPFEGYILKDVKVDNVSIGTVSSYTFNNINVDHTIEAIFEPIAFTITASASFGGSITPQGTVIVDYNSTKIFYINSDIGYKIKDVEVDGVSIGNESYYVFYNIKSNHTIEAFFENARVTLILQIGKDYFTINNDKKYLDSPPIIKNGRTLLPIRAIIEALGGEVTWDPATKTVDITLNNNFIRLQIGNAVALVNNEEKIIDPTNYRVVPEIINGRTMLPLRFIAENVGCDVQWDGATMTITITFTGE